MILFIVIDILIVSCCFLRLFKIRHIDNFTDGIMLIIFFSMSGLSYKIHNDYFAYDLLYPCINFSNYNLIKSFEIGYSVLNAAFNPIFSFYQFKAFIFFINTVLIYQGLKKIISLKKIFYVLMFLYFDLYFFPIYMSAFRQSISISIFIYSLQFVKNRKFFRYFLLICLATLFHKSSIILFVVYPLFNCIRIDIKNIMIYISIFIVNSFIPLFLSITMTVLNWIFLYFPSLRRGKSYFDVTLNGRISSLLALLILLFLINYKKIVKKQENIFWIKCFILYLFFSMLGSIFPVFYRIRVYFSIFMIGTMVIVLNSYGDNIIRRSLKIIFILFFLFFYDLKGIYTSYKEEGNYIPFHFSFETLYKDIPYESTSEYNHVVNRYKTTDIDALKEEVKRMQMPEK